MCDKYIYLVDIFVPGRRGISKKGDKWVEAQTQNWNTLTG
ncbi:hypothetical protein LCGC14_2057070 [marine sediment metagenome]|uniref:Uncharacterized protein n=1 Tax=marine sediment metagenome TaxID=412755 RepID=A0A0F9EM93_9ZZZZ